MFKSNESIVDMEMEILLILIDFSFFYVYWFCINFRMLNLGDDILKLWIFYLVCFFKRWIKIKIIVWFFFNSYYLDIGI